MPFSLSRRPCDVLHICSCGPKFDCNFGRFTPPPLPRSPKLKMELFTEYSCVLWLCKLRTFFGQCIVIYYERPNTQPFLRSCFENLICHTWCTNERQWVMLLPNVLNKLTLLYWERPINQTWRTSWQCLILTLQCTPRKAPWKISCLH